MVKVTSTPLPSNLPSVPDVMDDEWMMGQRREQLKMRIERKPELWIEMIEVEIGFRMMNGGRTLSDVFQNNG